MAGWPISVPIPPPQLCRVNLTFFYRPKARDYLLAHPEITLDDFAGTYSTSFDVSWPYDPSHVLIATPGAEAEAECMLTNPVFEEHMRHLKNWSVGKAFHDRFPELAKLTEEDSDT